MKRLMFVISIAALAVGVMLGGLFQVSSQTTRTTSTLRRIQVSSRTITTLRAGQKYVVDLTQRGVKYEFNHHAGPIDFSRVRVRTARGEVAIFSFLETLFPKADLPWFKYSSQPFSLQTGLPGTVRIPPTMMPTIGCRTGGTSSDRPPICQCRGEEDCDGMIKYMGVCYEQAVACVNNPLTGEKICSCVAKPSA